ncbi:MAG: Glutamate--tRNA ligase [Microgenomates bacterium OLB22]|nr:MAG: Glutamate--tRNA ligase [Microgenomates bacterium OLB22]
MVRTRIAPSPTGFAHIGTIYQVLFDYAYAKKNKGAFILRLEDTDRARFVEGAEEVVYDALDWFGLTEDESPRKPGKFGPYRQSERLELYKKYAQELVTKGHAYYCICTKERLDEVRTRQQKEGTPPKYDKHCLTIQEEVKEAVSKGASHVIRLNVPSGQDIVCHDEIRGDIVFSSDILDDQVLMKSDGFPTYHLAVVVDDHLMKISHVVRGEEWIPSMPKHVLLYQFFGWEIPHFYHTALLRNPDKSKLAKRHGHTSVSWYKEQGFLPEAILNFLAHMGWSHPEEKEVFSLDEFISVLELRDMRAAGPIFDLAKLEWMNGEYIRLMSAELLADKLFDFYEGKYKRDFISKTIPLIQQRIKTLKEYDDYCSTLAEPPVGNLDLSSSFSLVSGATIEALSSLENWKADEIGATMQAVAEKAGVKNSDYFMDMRKAILGKKITPPLNESLELIGQPGTVSRLKNSEETTQ